MERLVLCVIASDTVIQLLVKLLPGGGAFLEHILTVALEPTTLGARGAELGFSGTVVMTISLPWYRITGWGGGALAWTIQMLPRCPFFVRPKCPPASKQLRKGETRNPNGTDLTASYNHGVGSSIYTHSSTIAKLRSMYACSQRKLESAWPLVEGSLLLATCTERLTRKSTHQDGRSTVQGMQLLDHFLVLDVSVDDWHIRVDLRKGLRERARPITCTHNPHSSFLETKSSDTDSTAQLDDVEQVVTISLFVVQNIRGIVHDEHQEGHFVNQRGVEDGHTIAVRRNLDRSHDLCTRPTWDQTHQSTVGGVGSDLCNHVTSRANLRLWWPHPIVHRPFGAPHHCQARPWVQIHPTFGKDRFPAGRESGQKLNKKCLKPPTSNKFERIISLYSMFGFWLLTMTIVNLDS